MTNHDKDVADRLARIETRIAQLMIYLGADIHEPNKRNGLFDTIKAILRTHCRGNRAGTDSPETRDGSAEDRR